MWHILDRFLIHLTSGTTLVLATFMFLRVAARRGWTSWLPKGWKQNLVLAAVLVFAVSTLREGYDVAHGQSLTKMVTDYISWICGGGLAVWGLYRFKTEGE